MNIAHLVSYSAFSSSYPCFVIPVFSVVGSNLSYAQDLTLDGKVKEFRLFNDRDFFTVPVIPVDMKVIVGDPGIAAYWADTNEVWVGIFDAVKEKISDIDESALPAFVAVEAMTMLGDAGRLGRAADRVSKLIKEPSAANAYRDTIISRSVYMKKVSDKQIEISKSKPDNDLDQVLLQLQSDLTESDWYQIWSDGWRKFNSPSDLFGILKWKIDSGFIHIYQSVCIAHLARSNNKEYEDYAFRWLANNYSDHSSWTNVWFAFNDKLLARETTLDDSKINNLAIKFLSSLISRNPHGIVSHQWCLVWNRIWRKSFQREELENIAMRAALVKIHHSDSFVELVIRPLQKSIGYTEWIVSFYDSFLSKPQANTVWVQSYIEMYEHFAGTLNYRKAGLAWLERLGSGMNLWADLWRTIQKSEPTETTIDLSLSWLARARKDISSWPHVFEQTFHLMHNKSSDRLVEVAQLWMAANSRTHRDNVLIRAVADEDIK